MNRRLSYPDFQLGPIKLKEGLYSFKVWAPSRAKTSLKLYPSKGARRLIPMEKDAEGYFRTEISNISPGARYSYVLDEKIERPDPASHFQPRGVHGPSCLIDHDKYAWKDRSWKGTALRRMIIYEIHIGTFTREGTFEAAAKKLSYLKKLGITCVEVMPVAQFPGRRNWGYDGVGLYAVQSSYGAPEAFKRFIDACHGLGLAVCLDVVYNHLGPEGNYLRDFGPYFSNKYRTPWGEAINYDDSESSHVRRFIIENALHWISRYHIDALRLDAVQGIYDFSARHILEELNDAVMETARKLRRQVHVIAESDLNDSRIIRPKKQGGCGLSGQWNDDFHHALHSYFTGERQGYYEDFGRLKDIEKSLKDGFVYDGRYSIFRKRYHGNSAKGIAAEKFIVCLQNHDQTGNRAFGERFAALADFNRQKLAAVLLLLSPYTPLIFMGQEYAETAPFQYFIDHGDADLIRAVREGRKKEFASFGWEDIPDPAREETFMSSKLSWNLKNGGRRRYSFNLYRDLIALRKKIVLRSRFSRVWRDRQNRWIAFEYAGDTRFRYRVIVSCRDSETGILLPRGAGRWREIFNTAYSRYGGGLKPHAKKHDGKITLPAYAAILVSIRA